MTSELEHRLHLNRLRRRAEQTAHARPAFIERVREATGVQFGEQDFMNLAESDELSERAYERRKARVSDICWSSDGLENHVARTLQAVADAVELEFAYLVGHTSSETAGIAAVPVRPMLQNAFRYWRRSQEDFVLATADADDGLFLEWGAPCAGYELTVWGAFERALST
jgi:hypothetical protein